MAYLGRQPSTGVRNRYIYTATASQTTFSGSDDNSRTLRYEDAAYVDVYLNGVLLKPVTDYTATSKTSVVLTSAAAASDIVEIVAYDIANIADTVSKANGGTFDAGVTVNGTVTSDGLTVDGNLSVDNGTIKLDGNHPVGTGNVALGDTALDSNVSGGSNTAIGADALTANTASYNTAIGGNALKSNTTAQFNLAAGFEALRDNTTGADNTAIGGYQTLIVNTTGSYNTAVGRAALASNTTASSNTAVGYQALYDNSTGAANVAIGYASLANNTIAEKNVAVGVEAMETNTTGQYNTALGTQALRLNTTANNNTAVGYGAGYTNSTGINHTLIGKDAGYSTTGSSNTFVGVDSGYYVSSGGSNTILGRYNGNQGGLDIRTSSNNIVLSDGAGNPRLNINSSGDYSIGGLSVGAGNMDFFITPAKDGAIQWKDSGGVRGKIYTNGVPQFIVQTGGSGGVYLGSGATSWSAVSDERLKTVIGPYTNALDDITQINPVKFTWKSDSENIPQVGVLAQSVQSVVPESIDTFKNDGDETEYLSVRYTELIPIMIAALKEAKTKIETLEAKVAALETP